MKRKFTMPHTFVLLFIIIILVSIATYILPAGQYERILDESTNRVLIDPGSFSLIEQTPVSLFGVFQSVYDGMVQGASIIFFVFFAYGYVYMIIKSGALYGAIRILLEKSKGKEHVFIPIIMLIFGGISASAGLYDELYGVIPMVIGIAIAMGYDAMVGMAMICLSLGIGYAAAFMNPFTIGVAHSITDLPMFSGAWFRIIELAVFMIIGIWWTMRYAKKVKNNPEQSLVKNVDFGSLVLDKNEIENAEFNNRHKLIIAGFVLSFGIIMYGAIEHGWFLSEISGLFLIMMVVTSIIQRWSPNTVAELFLDSATEIIYAALIIGIARGVLVVLDSGNITDTLIYYMSAPLQTLPTYISAWFMLAFQSIINFFIPSGSGQAMVTIPIMAPIGDVIGLNRQIVVLAFQFGDGLSNLIWPTASIAVMCGMSRVPINKWWRFFLPVFGILVVVQIIFMTIATTIGYGPF
jgi:uncharacterized ion transporter superfamily protein YfcC